MTIILLIAAFLGGVFVGTRLPTRDMPLIASLINPEEKATSTQQKKELPPAGDLAKVVQVLDGDTIIIEGGEQVHYIGIDAPENTEIEKNTCFADQATAANKKLAEGKSVRLVKDTSDRDPLNRILRYVYAEDENGRWIMINEKLVSEGAAIATPYPPDTKFEAVLKKAEEEARAAKRGFWATCSN